MTTHMYDAREALIPGSVYDRTNQGNIPNGHGPPQYFPRPGPGMKINIVFIFCNMLEINCIINVNTLSV